MELEFEDRERGGVVTHVFETFLAEDGVQEPRDGCVVWHPVCFAEARQVGWWCDFATLRDFFCENAIWIEVLE